MTFTTDRKLGGMQLLVEHCFALCIGPARPAAIDRLEAMIGHDLTHRLVFALTRPSDD
jgi:hypothetical protein